jgi:hypothetical protein
VNGADRPDDRIGALVVQLYAALAAVLPLAEKYLAQAPSHPDHAKLEDARAALRRVRDHRRGPRRS